MTTKEILQKIVKAGELTDLPGHCKLCGSFCNSEEFPFYDPDGIGKPLFFCSSTCLYSAEHLFDDLSLEMLGKLEKEISQAESLTVIKS